MRNAFVLLFALFVSWSSFAQDKKNNDHPRITLANIKIPPDGHAVTTSAQILSLPKLVFTPDCPGCKVYSFLISFTPKGRDIVGPYYHHKGPDLSNEEIALVKKLVGMHTLITIEDIKVATSDGQARNMGSLFLTYDY